MRGHLRGCPCRCCQRADRCVEARGAILRVFRTRNGNTSCTGAQFQTGACIETPAGCVAFAAHARECAIPRNACLDVRCTQSLRTTSFNGIVANAGARACSTRAIANDGMRARTLAGCVWVVRAIATPHGVRTRPLETLIVVPVEGVEPPTFALRMRCSTS